MRKVFLLIALYMVTFTHCNSSHAAAAAGDADVIYGRTLTGVTYPLSRSDIQSNPTPLQRMKELLAIAAGGGITTDRIRVSHNGRDLVKDADVMALAPKATIFVILNLRR